MRNRFRNATFGNYAYGRYLSYAFLLIIAFPISFSFPKGSRTGDTQEDKVHKGNFKELVTNKNYIFILIIIMLTTVIVDCAMNYAGNHLISTLGGFESLISWMVFITVLPEVLFLMFTIKVINKLGLRSFIF
jgi:Na+/melibiose symporter-like transporter